MAYFKNQLWDVLSPATVFVIACVECKVLSEIRPFVKVRATYVCVCVEWVGCSDPQPGM